MHEGDKMGNYNTQYQSYYNNLSKKSRGINNFVSGSMGQGRLREFYINRLTRELIGVLVLFIFVLICKVFVTPKTQYVYNYSKQVINMKYDYNALIDKAKSIGIKDIEAIPVNFIEKFKSTIFNEKSILDINDINSTKSSMQQF